MQENSSNQALLQSWKEGNEQAASILVRRYMVRLTALAQSRLSQKLARRLDPEDIVLSAWRSFFVAVENSRIATMSDDNLWPLLVTMTLRKLSRQAKRHGAEKRNVEGAVSLESAEQWSSIITREPLPEEAASVVEDVEQLLKNLSRNDRDVLEMLLLGETQSAIAIELDCSERTIRRSVQRIRETYLRMPPNAETDGGLDTTTPPEQSKELDLNEPGTDATEFFSSEPDFQYTDLVLKQFLGEGGFGKVFAAQIKSNQKEVAVKFLKKRFWKDDRSVQSLLRESSQVKRLSHSNIVDHYGWGRTTHGAVFLVMENVAGMSCSKWIQYEQPSLLQIVSCGLAIAKALIATHQIGVIHGDVTPMNVLVTRDCQFLLTDFGFARSKHQHQLLHAGGTPGYLAPEQISNSFGEVMEMTDLYGLGALLYSLVSGGEPPMKGKDIPESLANVLSSRSPEPLPEVGDSKSHQLYDLIFRCLQKEITDRPQSASEVYKKLSNISRRISPT